MQTHPSATNMVEQTHFTLPPGAMSGPLGPTQQARFNQSTASAGDINQHTQPTSPTSTKDSSGAAFDRPRRTSSMTINPSTASVQQSSTMQPQQQFQQQQWQGDGETLGLTRTTSSATLDGEPRLFPGVVSGDRSRRRSSMRISAVEDGAYVGHRKGGGEGSVTEEREKEKDLEDEE